MRKIKTLAIVGTVLAGYGGYELYNNYTEQDSVLDSSANPVSGSLTDPVLNSPADITDELISDIIDNRINSLTINYEFTRCKNAKEKRGDWEEAIFETNPFLILY